MRTSAGAAFLFGTQEPTSAALVEAAPSPELPQPQQGHAAWSLEDILWDPEQLVASGSPSPPRAEASEPLLPRPPRAASSVKLSGPSGPSLRGAPHCCQVPDCGTPWSSFAAYNRRLRLCEQHIRAESYTPRGGGAPHRVCLKCNRGHELTEFDGAKRACRRQLARFNERKRAAYAANKHAAAAAAAAGGGCGSHEEASSTAAMPPLAGEGDDELLRELEALFSTAPATMGAPPEGPEGPAGPEEEGGARGGGGGWWPLHAAPSVTLELKLEGTDAHPARLPPGLRAAAASLFEQEPLALHGAVAPGCTRLTLQATLRGGGGGPAPAQALAALLASAGPVGAYLRSLERVAVGAPGAEPHAEARRGVALPPSIGDAEAGAALPPPAWLAARSDVPARLPLPRGAGLRCRLHGRLLRCAVEPADAGGGLELALAAAGEEGLCWLEAASWAGRAPPPAPRPLVLCADAALVAELNTAAARGAAGDRAALDVAAALVGAALRPGCPAAVAACAAAAAMRRRWPAATERCLAALAKTPLEDDDDDEGDVGAGFRVGWLMHEAAADAAPADALVALLRHRHGAVAPARFGAPHEAGGFFGGATPLHVLARHADANAAATAAELLTAPGGGALAADAAAAWLLCRDDAGATPAALAAARPDRDERLRTLAPRLEARLARGRAAALSAAEGVLASHGVVHFEESAAAALHAAADDDAAALAGALLRLAAAARRRHGQLSGSDGDSLPIPEQVPAAKARLASPASSPAEEGLWRLAQCRHMLEAWALYHVLYCASQLARAAPEPDWQALPVSPEAPSSRWAAAGVPVEMTRSWAANFPIMDWVAPFSFWYQAAATTALLAALLAARLAPRCRTALAAHLQPFLVLQFAVHALVCTWHQTCLVCGVVMDARGTVLVWPVRLAVAIVLFTLFAGITLPLAPRWAAPLLAARGLPPLLVLLAPARFYRLWPLLPQREAALQAVACAAAFVLALARDRSLRRRYAEHHAALAAADAAADKGDTCQRD